MEYTALLEKQILGRLKIEILGGRKVGYLLTIRT